MLFNSLGFLVAFPLFCAVFFAVPARYQRPLLLLASLAACAAWGWLTLAALVAITAIGYGFGQALAHSPSAWRLALGVSIVIAPLVVLKYANFAMSSLQTALGWAGLTLELPELAVAMPVGLSFYTFVVVGYLVDVQLERIGPAAGFGRFALFTSFFPKFLSGPVERAADLLPQLEVAKRFDYDRVTDGLRIMGWGFFKKLVVADRLALVVDGVYQSPESYQGLVLGFVSVLYMFQIYYDFEAYSDLAVGAARVLGYDLTWNFDRPYAARSITDYWRRWHISLTSWFFDYIFFPLVASLRSWNRAATVVALFVTFLVSGLWHGAGWTFVLFGLAHGVVMSFEVLSAKPRKRLRARVPRRLYEFVAWTLTFSFLACVDVLFRAASVAEAWTVWSNLFGGIVPDLSFLAQRSFSPTALKSLIAGLPVLKIELLIGVGAIAIVEIVSLIGKQQPVRSRLLGQPTIVRWAVYYAVAGAIVFFGAHGTTTEFVYMQF